MSLFMVHTREIMMNYLSQALSCYIPVHTLSTGL